MTGKTHRVGGMLCVLGGFSYLESKGLLLRGVNPILQLTVMYPFAIYGSIFCDLDHEIGSIPSKDIVSIALNRVLHLTSKANELRGGKRFGLFAILDAKHRSWQTHSDLFLVALLFGLYKLIQQTRMGTAESVIISLVGMGFVLGVVSHLILDMLTPEGIWSLGMVAIGRFINSNKYMPKKIKLVPYSKFFYTGGVWEGIVRKVLWVACGLLFIRVLYLMSPYRIVFNFR